MEFRNYKNDKQIVKETQKLYYEAFPKKQRLPFFFLKHKASQQVADLIGVYDNSQFVGMLYCVYHKDIVFVFYLAVAAEGRGKGYGSKILAKLRRRLEGKSIVLSIEDVNEESENNVQRKKRKKFYLCNGFREAGYKTKENGVIYEFLCCGKQVEVEEYWELLKNYLGSFLYNIYGKKIVSRW